MLIFTNSRQAVQQIILQDIVIQESAQKFIDKQIVFNYLPMKNLLFFNLNFKKSSIEKKCWVYLDLNLNKLYDFLIEGKLLTNRQILILYQFS